MAWEDLHWADPTTLEALGMLIEQAPTAALLVVATYRPELTPPWPQRSHMTPITLNRLERPEVETMVGHLAGGRPLPREVVDHIVAKADGVPLYVEELTKAILGSGLLEARDDAYVLTGALAQLHPLRRGGDPCLACPGARLLRQAIVSSHRPIPLSFAFR
jgi:predicted ATPase